MSKLRITNYELQIFKKITNYKGRETSIILREAKDLDSSSAKRPPQNDKKTIRYTLYAFLCFALLLGCGARPGSDDGSALTGKTGNTGNSASGSGTSSTTTDSDGDGASDSCELTQGTDPLNATDIPDYCPDANTQTLCMLYEEQKKQNELADNSLYDADCKNVTVPDANGDSSIQECTYTPINTQDASTLTNYGDPNAATVQTINIKLTYGGLFRDLIFIQNGVLTIKPWYFFHNERKTQEVVKADRNFWDKLFDSINLGYLIGGFSLGSLTENAVKVADYHYNHQLGAEASAGNDCDHNMVNKAIVNINGTDYVWMYPGFTAFRISEYLDKYAPSTDSVTFNNASTNYSAVPAGNFTNGFYDMTHVIQVTNLRAEKNKNHGCRNVTVDFSISYYKANGANSPTPSDLEKLCAEYNKE